MSMYLKEFAPQCTIVLISSHVHIQEPSNCRRARRAGVASETRCWASWARSKRAHNQQTSGQASGLDERSTNRFDTPPQLEHRKTRRSNWNEIQQTPKLEDLW